MAPIEREHSSVDLDRVALFKQNHPTVHAWTPVVVFGSVLIALCVVVFMPCVLGSRRGLPPRRDRRACAGGALPGGGAESARPGARHAAGAGPSVMTVLCAAGPLLSSLLPALSCWCSTAQGPTPAPCAATPPVS